MSDAHDPFHGTPGGPPPPPGYQQPQYPPQQPQYPPTQPQYPPTQAQPQYPPTQAQPQYPPTQQVPAGGYGPGPGQMPGYGIPPTGAPAPKKTGMMVGAGVAVAAVLGGGAFLLLGGDDDKATTPAATTVAIATTVDGTATTLATPTTAPVATVVLTQPVTTMAVTVPPTAAPTAPPTPGAGRVTDELGVFSVLAPDGFESDPSSITSADGITIASVIVADSVDGFLNDHDTSGFQTFVAAIADDVSADSLLGFIEPGEGECASVSPNFGFPTAYGGGTLMVYTGCGSNGAEKRVLVVEVPGAGVVIGVYMQELPSEVDLTNVTQIILESVQLN